MESNYPGIHSEQFTLYFAENYFKPYKSELYQLKWYFRWLGFYLKYESKLMADSIQIKPGTYIYELKVMKKILYWTKFKLYTKDLRNGK